MTSGTDTSEDIVMEAGDRQWFKDLLKAELNPIKKDLSNLPCTDHENRITVCQTKIEVGKDWRTWLLALGMLVVGAVSVYAVLKKG